MRRSRAGERLDDDDLVEGRAARRTSLMNIRVVDDAKRELAMGRDLGELSKRLGEAASLTLAQGEARAWSARASRRGTSATCPRR